MAQLTQEQIEEIAELAATKAIAKMENHFYTSVGRNFINKFFIIIGMLVVAGSAWLAAKGIK